ncbi:hypothetical protein ACQY0O_007801 [Thecaphora frezii]
MSQSSRPQPSAGQRPRYVLQGSPLASSSRSVATPAKRTRISGHGSPPSLATPSHLAMPAAPAPTPLTHGTPASGRAPGYPNRPHLMGRSAYDQFDEVEWLMDLSSRIKSALQVSPPPARDSRASTPGTAPRRSRLSRPSREFLELQQSIKRHKAQHIDDSGVRVAAAEASPSERLSREPASAAPLSAKEWAKRAQEEFEKRQAAAAAAAAVTTGQVEGAASEEDLRGSGKGTDIHPVVARARMAAESIKELFSGGGLEAEDDEAMDFTELLQTAEPLAGQAFAGPSSFVESFKTEDGAIDIQSLLQHRALLAEQQAAHTSASGSDVTLSLPTRSGGNARQAPPQSSSARLPLIKEVDAGAAANGGFVTPLSGEEADASSLDGEAATGQDGTAAREPVRPSTHIDLEAEKNAADDINEEMEGEGQAEADHLDVDRMEISWQRDLDDNSAKGADEVEDGDGVEFGAAAEVDELEGVAAEDEEDQVEDEEEGGEDGERKGDDDDDEGSEEDQGALYEVERRLATHPNGRSASSVPPLDDEPFSDKEDEEDEEDEDEEEGDEDEEDESGDDEEGDSDDISEDDYGTGLRYLGSDGPGAVADKPIVLSDSDESDAELATSPATHAEAGNDTRYMEDLVKSFHGIGSGDEIDEDEIDEDGMDDEAGRAPEGASAPDVGSALPSFVPASVLLLPKDASPLDMASAASPENHESAGLQATNHPVAEVDPKDLSSIDPQLLDALLDAPTDASRATETASAASETAKNAHRGSAMPPPSPKEVGVKRGPATLKVTAGATVPLPTREGGPSEGVSLEGPAPKGEGLGQSASVFEDKDPEIVSPPQPPIFSSEQQGTRHSTSPTPTLGGLFGLPHQLLARRDDDDVGIEAGRGGSGSAESAAKIKSKTEAPSSKEAEACNDGAPAGGEALGTEEEPVGDGDSNDRVAPTPDGAATAHKEKASASVDDKQAPARNDSDHRESVAEVSDAGTEEPTHPCHAPPNNDPRPVAIDHGAMASSSPLSSVATLPPDTPLRTLGGPVPLSALPPSSVFRQKHRHHHGPMRTIVPLGLRTLSIGSLRRPLISGPTPAKLEPVAETASSANTGRAAANASRSGQELIVDTQAAVESEGDKVAINVSHVAAKPAERADVVAAADEYEYVEESHGPSTRSQCSFHRLRFLKLDGHPTFIVPQCSIMHDVAKEEGARDVGEASERENEVKVDFDADDLPLEIRHSLSRIIGFQMLPEAAVVPGSSAAALLVRLEMPPSSDVDMGWSQGDATRETGLQGAETAANQPGVAKATRHRRTASAASSNDKRSPKRKHRDSDADAPNASRNEADDGQGVVENPERRPLSSSMDHVSDDPQKEPTAPTLAKKKIRGNRKKSTDGSTRALKDGDRREETPPMRIKQPRRSKGNDDAAYRLEDTAEGERSGDEEVGSMVTGVQTRKRYMEETEVLGQIVGGRAIEALDQAIDRAKGLKDADERREAKAMELDDEDDDEREKDAPRPSGPEMDAEAKASDRAAKRSKARSSTEEVDAQSKNASTTPPNRSGKKRVSRRRSSGRR